MKSLFFNNCLFLNVIRTIILYSYYMAFGEGEGGRSCSGDFVSAFPSGFYFDCFVFFLLAIVLLASVLSLTLAKIMTCSKYFKTKYFFLLYALCCVILIAA